MAQEQQQQQTPRVDLQRFKAILQNRVPVAARFSIDARHYAADVPDMLTACYVHEVERRGKVYKDDEATRQHIASVSKWLTNPRGKPGLFLYGNIGSGKTTLARSIAQLISLLYGNEYHYDDRKGVVTVSALQLADEAKKEDGGRLSLYRTTELLHIDDVGTEPASLKVWGNEVSPLTDILYRRYDNMLYTVITSNLYEDDICKRYGERIGDRFREIFDLLSFDNRSYR